LVPVFKESLLLCLPNFRYRFLQYNFRCGTINILLVLHLQKSEWKAGKDKEEEKVNTETRA